MYKKHRMNVATSLNSKYTRYACVMVTSLLENQPSDTEVHVYLLYSDLTEENKKSLAETVQSYEGIIHWLFVDKKVFSASCPVNVFWTLEAYYRLLLPELLPEDADRLLYLDVDIIVNQSLWELYDTDLEGKVLCVCPDSGAEWSDVRNEIFKEQLEKGFTYFNSGVLLFDMKKMREKYCFDDYMKLAEKLEYKFLAPDQDLLNYMHWEEVKFADSGKYNLFAKLAYNCDIHYEQAKQEAVILHFAGQKPWLGQYVHYDIEKLWWDYAKKTPFYCELMEEFVQAVVSDPLVYDTLAQSAEEKKQLQEELDKSAGLCRKMLQLLQEKQG